MGGPNILHSVFILLINRGTLFLKLHPLAFHRRENRIEKMAKKKKRAVEETLPSFMEILTANQGKHIDF